MNGCDASVLLSARTRMFQSKCAGCLVLSRAKHDRSSTSTLHFLYINVRTCASSLCAFPSGPSYPHSPALRESQEMFGTCPETPASPRRAASAGNVGFQAMLVNAVISQRDTPGNGSEMRKETVKQEWKSRERKQFYHCQKKTPRIALGELNNSVARRAQFLRRKSICFDHTPPIDW